MTAEDAVRALSEEHGLQLKVVGKCPGGEVGAYFVDADDGTRYVLKWTDNDDVEFFEHLVPRLNAMRTDGYLLPRHQSPFRVDAGTLLLQERVDGEWSDEVDANLVDTVLRLNNLQSDRGRGGDTWTNYVRSTLVEGAEGYCVHATLRDHNNSSRSLLEWIREVGATVPHLPESDVVHVDFHHRNMLRRDLRLIAVVDWEGARLGDRAFDLVTFCFGFTHAHAPAGLEDVVWERAVEIADSESLRAYVAHMALRRLDWTIRHHDDEIEALTAFIDRYVDRVA